MALIFQVPNNLLLWYEGGGGVCNVSENQSSVFNFYFLSFRKKILKVWLMQLYDDFQNNTVFYSIQ